MVDPTINSDMMEMYADYEAHGNVLEPDGTVEIKFKKEDSLKTMQRLDKEYSFLLLTPPRPSFPLDSTFQV